MPVSMKMQSPQNLFHMRKSAPLFCALLLSLSARRAWIEIALEATVSSAVVSRSPQGEYGMFLFLTVQGGFVHADIRFNFKN